MPGMVWLDGRLVPADGPHLSVTDRGFQLGDGIFETLRVRRGVPIEFEEHARRLRENAAILELPLAADDSALLRALRDLLEAEGLAGRARRGATGPEVGDAAVRITASRGPLDRRGLLPAGVHDLRGTLVIQAWPFAPPPTALLERGARTIVATHRHDPASPLAGVKSTSRADSVFARLEADRRGVDDAIFLTLDGALSEATTANLFLVRGRELATPPLDAGLLPGTTRTWLLAHAGRLGLVAAERRLVPGDLADADEAFLSSSVAGVVPLTWFEDRPVGAGAPGEATLRLRAAREAWIDEESLRGVQP